MRTELYSVYDAVAKEHAPLFHAHNEQHAIRLFVRAMKENPDRADFRLVQFGEFDTEAGVLTAIERREVEIVVPDDPAQALLVKEGSNGR